MIKKGLWKKSASILMAAAMIMTSVPVYAAEAEEQSGEVIVQEASEETAEDAQEVLLEEAAGKEAVAAETGGAEESDPTSTTVAKIGDQGYPSLKEAIAAVEGPAEIVLQQDTNITTSDLTVAEGKTVTLDLKGHKIEAANTLQGNIQVEGELTLKDSTDTSENGNGSGMIYTTTPYGNDSGYLIIDVKDAGSFIMDSGYINTVINNNPKDQGQFGVGVTGNNASVTINGGKIESGWYAVSGNGTNKTKPGSTIKINGGELLSTADYAIYHPQAGELTINGGTIYGQAGGIAINRGRLIVNNGVITSKGVGDTGNWGDGTGNLNNAAINLNAEYGDVTAEINGGKISAEETAVTILEGNNNKVKVALSVSGGTFYPSIDEKYCAPGYKLVQSGDGQTVEKLNKENASVQVISGGEESYYDTLADAVKSANDGDRVVLLNNISSTRVEISKSIVLDLNNFTISNEAEDYTFGIAGNYDVTVQNGTIETVKGFYCTAGQLTLSDVNLTTTGRSISNYGNSTVTIGTGTEVCSSGEWPVVIRGDVGQQEGSAQQEGPTLNVSGKIQAVSDSCSAISGNGTDSSGTTININEGASIEAPTLGIYHPQSGTLNVSGGSISGDTGIEMRAGDLNISGDPVITGNAKPVEVKPNGSGSTTSGAAIAVSQHTTKRPINVTISGGTISGFSAVYESNPQNNSQEGLEKVNLSITGGSFKAINGGSAVIYSEDKAGFISGGIFSHIPEADYIAEGQVAVPYDDAEYLYTIGEKTAVDVTPASGEADVDVSSLTDMSEDEKQSILKSVKTMEAPGLAAIASVKSESISQQEVEQLKAKAQENDEFAEGATINIYAMSYLDIKVESYSSDADSDKQLTLDVQPMFQFVASTAESASEITDNNSLKLGNPEKLNDAEVKRIKNLHMSIELPGRFVADASAPIYVEHIKESANTVYNYVAEVTFVDGKFKAEFDNPHGFSTMILRTKPNVAAIGTQSYPTVDAAIEAANGETVKLLENVNEAVTVGENASAILDLNGHTIKGALTNNGNLTITDTSAGKEGEITGAITSNGTTAIEAGNFSGALSTGNNGKFSISGGTFALDSVKSEYCAPGYKPNADGTGVTRIQTPSYSTNNNLSSLTISEGTLTPAFNKDTTSYTVSVGADVESITVTPVRENNYATIKVNGTSVTSGEASAPIALKEGENTITVEVTAESGAKKTYTLTVTRETASTPTPTPAPASDASLSDLTISEGTLSPEFSAEEENYKAVVENAVDKLLVTPKTAGANSKVTVNGKPASEEVELKVGYNTIKVEVTAEDGKTTKTYTIDVTRVVPKNKTLTIRRRKYKVTNELIAKGAVQITGLSDKKVYNLSVPDTIKIYGVTYKVTSVGKNAFRDQPKMKTAKLGNNITSIGYGAFYSCPRLKSITLGKRVKSIGNHAFCRDVKLRTLTLEGTALTKVAAHTLYKTKNLTIKAPASKVKAYKKLFTGKGTKSFKVVKK